MKTIIIIILFNLLTIGSFAQNFSNSYQSVLRKVDGITEQSENGIIKCKFNAHGIEGVKIYGFNSLGKLVFLITQHGVDNGILTASEISNLNLSTCELVVMSACETGLGDIKGSDVVYGLQRAFKMAGVKNIIMSLWQVPDKQTSELFIEFYKLAFNGRSIHEAFKMAQSKMRKKYNPYYWAGFVLLE